MAGNIAALVALVLNLAAALYLVFLPAYSGVSTYQDTAGLVQTTTTSATLIEANGWSVLVPILVPVVVCIGAFALRHTAAAPWPAWVRRFYSRLSSF
ncbi:MAG TPA: hypothetical protein VK864_00550 [Longimicrobiales bacterium]|nr:hypothetical protein [Longimicrobiales bacterium]